MAEAVVCAFADSAAAARDFASHAGLPLHFVGEHRFPDGETLIRANDVAAEVFLFRSLHHPTAKIFELLLAASALRDGGASLITLVAPYLGYMRQDTAFHQGEAVSQRVMGDIIARYVDRVVSVEPHLHRTHDFSAVFPGRQALAVSGAPGIAAAMGAKMTNDTLVVGPDEESAPLAQTVAAPMGLQWAVGTKVRHGDRDVDLRLPADIALKGRPVLIVDDVISSGVTILAVAAAAHGAASIDVVCVHALFDDAMADKFVSAGIRTVSSGDGVPHQSSSISLAPVMVKSMREKGWL